MKQLLIIVLISFLFGCSKEYKKIDRIENRFTNNDTIVKQPIIIQDVNYPPLPGGDPDSETKFY